VSGVVSESVNSGTFSLFSSDFALVDMFIAIIDTVSIGIKRSQVLPPLIIFLSVYYSFASALRLASVLRPLAR